MDNKVVTRLSVLEGRKLRFEVQTDDLGNQNRGGVHLWDKNRNYVDVKLDWNRKVGSDDLFVGEVSLDDLPAGFDTSEIHSTAFVDTPSSIHGNWRDWEGRDLKVQPAPRNAIYDIAEAGELPFALRSFKGHADTRGGKVELDVLQKPQTGYKSAYGSTAIKGIRFEDKNNFFGGAAKVDVVLMPVVDSTDRRGEVFSHDYVKKELELDTKMNTVTLKKQADGAYAADAGYDRGFLNLAEYTEYMGDALRLKAVDIALVDPATGKWDSNGSKNYRVPIN